MTTFRLLVALLATVLTIWTGPVRAEPLDKKAMPRKVLRLEEMKVEGRIRKPQAMFLMPRANLSVGELDRNPSFVPKVSKAAEKDPF
ncbi:MAG TPA: hypothetical protein VFE30_12785 [Anaeromyxobacteraceae bacterium]|jgi:hypothetical protein|nr:hypothetical protein [Anaeromyxobacteraceae bacterium]